MWTKALSFASILTWMLAETAGAADPTRNSAEFEFIVTTDDTTITVEAMSGCEFQKVSFGTLNPDRRHVTLTNFGISGPVRRERLVDQPSDPSFEIKFQYDESGWIAIPEYGPSWHDLEAGARPGAVTSRNIVDQRGVRLIGD